MMYPRLSKTHYLLFLLLPGAAAFSSNNHELDSINRRNALRKAIINPIQIAALSSLYPSKSKATGPTDSYIAKPGYSLRLPSSPNNPRSKPILIPRIAYSLYKTDPSQVEQGISLALDAGVRYFDLATLYGSNTEAGKIFHSFIETGVIPNATNVNKDTGISKIQQIKRRNELFISHKVSNAEQSNSKDDVKRGVKMEMEKLQVDYLDMCSIHSPLTDKGRRLATYEALLELKEENLVRAVGVCNYGVFPLEEIVSAGLPPPSINQLELSPFNQHKDVAQWAKRHGVTLSCSAWSKLSSVSGPQEGWATIAEMAKQKGVTKQQILIRWALHRGYTCSPRSGVRSEIERNAIAENSYIGVSGFALSEKDIILLDSLDENLKAGRLGRRDGWGDDDVKGEDWDPTEFVTI